MLRPINSLDYRNKMEACVLIIRMVNCLILVIEMLVLVSANSLGMTALPFPKKFNGHNDLKPEQTSTVRRSRSDLFLDHKTKSNIGGDSFEKREQTRILDFIHNIKTNTIAQDSYCDSDLSKAWGRVINLSNFKYTFAPSSFQTFEKEAKDAKFIANYFNDMYVQDSTFRLTSLNDAITRVVISWLKRLLIDDHVLAGAGVAFSDNKFFPYIYKTSKGLIIDDLGEKRLYKDAPFYSFHIQKTINQSKFSSTSVSGARAKEEDIYWGSPIFDCSYLKRWITTVSTAFHSRQGNDAILK